MKVMIIRTKHEGDIATNYTHAWLEAIISNADSIGWDIVDLRDKAANRQMTEAWIQEFDPELIIAAGHGFATEFIGDDNKPIFTYQNAWLLKDRTTFLLSCSIGAGLGKRIGQIGGCFIGWNIPVVWTTEPGEHPMDDHLAAPVREASLAIANTLLEGGSVNEAYLKARDIFDMWIMTFTYEGISDREIRYVEENRKGLMSSCPAGTLGLQTMESFIPVLALTAGLGAIIWWARKN